MLKQHQGVSYIIARIKIYLYFKLNKNVPWLSRKCNNFLNNYLKDDMLCVEFGSGKSTKWISNRVSKLISVEHNEKWYDYVNKEIDRIKVDYILVKNEAYVNTIDSIDDETIDFCLIDGIFRDKIAVKIISKLKPQALLLIDDAQRYFIELDSKSPKKGKYFNEDWKKFNLLTQDWRRIHFTNGVTDQLLLFKKV